MSKELQLMQLMLLWWLLLLLLLLLVVVLLMCLDSCSRRLIASWCHSW
jgi:hypothetical protein